ncbi:hypothetical protein L210DRAFT_3513611 [Boletus edulis BED1]|uniref:Uncharacterized protein n=1 Tax=Boletus edulis BED1 TaxID=1328754 RepID=A0AAD4B8X4_BOLED|nr:hypothetical protein L210DRAFT_3513611 [Boletus edulis BED1]
MSDEESEIFSCEVVGCPDDWRVHERERSEVPHMSRDGNALHQYRPPGGCRGEHDTLGAVKAFSNREIIIDDGLYDVIGRRNEENERVVETNAQRQDGWPGDQMGK